MQQPNDGSGQGDMTDGYVVSGTDIIFDSAPPSGSTYFIINMGATIAIGTPGDNTVTSAKIVDGTIVNADISSSAAIARTKLANVDVVDDTSPQLGGDLASSGNNILMADNDSIKVGTGNDLEIFHDGTDTKVDIDNGQLLIRNASNAQILAIQQDKDIFTDGHVHFADSVEARFGASSDLKIYHSGSHSFIQEEGTGSLYIDSNQLYLRNADTDNVLLYTTSGGEVRIAHNGNEKFRTESSGVNITGNATSSVSSLTDGSTITVNFDTASHFTVTLGGNRTFAQSSSNAVGSSGSIFIVQDGTGGRTASFGSAFKFAGGTAPTLSTAANAVDRLDFVVRAADNVHCVVTLDVK